MEKVGKEGVGHERDLHGSMKFDYPEVGWRGDARPRVGCASTGFVLVRNAFTFSNVALRCVAFAGACRSKRGTFRIRDVDEGRKSFLSGGATRNELAGV